MEATTTPDRFVAVSARGLDDLLQLVDAVAAAGTVGSSDSVLSALRGAAANLRLTSVLEP